MKKTALALGLVLAALALVACGGSDGGATSGGETGAATESEGNAEAEGEGGGSVVEIEADPSGGLSYTTTEASAEAGEVVVEFTNDSPIEHDVDIEDANGEVVLETDIVTESAESASADLPAGEYTFYCSVPGHREAGMEGTLVVE
ncbi:MAG: cupredoxin domain-containing protein [Solirubrobacterales bacterium]